MRILTLLIILLVFFLQTPPVFATHQLNLQEEELKSLGFSGYERINPNLLVYPIKRAIEVFKLFSLTTKEEKKVYFDKLFEIRFKELVYIANSKKEGFIFFAADRYNTFVGKLKKDYPPDSSSKVEFQRKLKMLEILRDIYPSNSPYWEKLQQTIDTTKSLI